MSRRPASSSIETTRPCRLTWALQSRDVHDRQRDARVGAQVLEATAARVHVHEHAAVFPDVPCRDRHRSSVRAHGGDDRRVRLRQEGVQPRRQRRFRHAASLAPPFGADAKRHLHLRADARRNLAGRAGRRRLALRDQVGRLPRDRARRRRRRAAAGRATASASSAAARGRRRGAARTRSRSTDCVLDGELCAFDEDGVPSFELFQRGEGAIAYVVFDLLELDGEPLIARALEPAPRAARASSIVPARRVDRALAGLRGRRGAARRRAPARPRGRHGQARRRALPAGAAQRRLAQDQAAPGGRPADRRLHERPGRARAARRADPRHRRPRVRRQLRQRPLRRGHARAARERSRRCGARPRRCAARGPAGAARARVTWVEPDARVRGRVRRVDARPPPARARLQATREGANP